MLTFAAYRIVCYAASYITYATLGTLLIKQLEPEYSQVCSVKGVILTYIAFQIDPSEFQPEPEYLISVIFL